MAKSKNFAIDPQVVLFVEVKNPALPHRSGLSFVSSPGPPAAVATSERDFAATVQLDDEDVCMRMSLPSVAHSSSTSMLHSANTWSNKSKSFVQAALLSEPNMTVSNFSTHVN